MRGYIKYFSQSIKVHYEQDYENILAQMNNELETIKPDVRFATVSKNPVDRRLEFIAYFLALVKVLDKNGEGYDNIRQICIEITTNYVKPRNKFEAFIKRFLPKLAGYKLTNYFLKKLASKVSKLSDPNGFVCTIITDKDQTYGLGYGVDILECGICKLFHKHDYYKYASILCEVDEITSGLAGLELIRSGTIANGAKKCDFRYRIKH